jgi:hypothetical protein
MSAEFDITAATPILKERYTLEDVQTIAFKSAALGIIKKDTTYGGKEYIGAIRNAVGSTASHTPTVSFGTGGSASQYQQWKCQYAQSFASAAITDFALKSSKGDVNALVDGAMGEFDGAFIDLGQMLGADLYGSGGGSFGQISATSNVGTATITLTDPSGMVSFLDAQVLQLSSDNGYSGSAGVRSGTVTLLSVDVMAGTLTATGNWTAGIAAAAAGDFIYGNGNYQGAYAGFSGWLPDVNNRGNLGTAFNNVVRSLDPVRLAGWAYNGNGAPKEQTIKRLASYVQRMNGRPDYCLMNPIDYNDIETDLGNRVQYNTVESFHDAQISFDAISLATPYGNIKILLDAFCPVGTGYLINFNEWVMPSLGEVPDIWGEGVDGLTWLRQTDNSYQCRMVAYATTYCSAPGHQGVITW